ncbi:peptidylprolyl isomerase, partial [Lacticaseibacillus paracasei]
LAKDSISAPVRTKYGYHLIKLNDSRPNSGQVRVKHLYKYVKEGDSAKVLKQIYSIRNTINNDASFNSAVRSFSDDYDTIC